MQSECYEVTKMMVRNRKKEKAMSSIAKISHWDKEKGFGYLRDGKKKLFLHRGDFTERHKRPQVGDRVHFQRGCDAKGRKCAVNVRHVNDGGKLTIWTWLCVLLLVALPILSVTHAAVIHSIPLSLVSCYIICINIITYRTYKGDKMSARLKSQRVPESTLHMLEGLGGWPLAFIAQRHLRHKCSKMHYQSTFWFIVACHYFIAIDYMYHWRILGLFFGSGNVW